MTNPIHSVYPLDLSMSLPSNYIQNEKKIFEDAGDRMFVPDGGPFFSQSLVLKDSKGKLLKPKVDYMLLHLNEEATLESGRDVVTVVSILKETIASVTLDYRVVGGAYSSTVSGIIQMIQDGGGAGSQVDWNIHVFNKPEQFPTAPHFHTPDTFTDWAMVYSQLHGIRQAIIHGDDASWESHYNYIDRKLGVATTSWNSQLENYTTIQKVNEMLSGLNFDVDLGGYYTQTQIDGKFAVTNKSITDVKLDLQQNYYSKTMSDSRYAYKTDAYTKAQSDLKYALKDDYYTKVQSDARYVLKEALSAYATTIQLNAVENRLGQRIDNAIIQAGNVDLSSYYKKVETYSRSEVDNLIRTAKNEAIADAGTAAGNLISSTMRDYVFTYDIVNLAHAANHSTTDAHWNGKSVVRVNATVNAVSTVNISTVGAGIAVGRTLTIRNVGAGEVKLVAKAGVTLVPNEPQTLRRSGSTATLIYVGNNTFDVITELE